MDVTSKHRPLLKRLLGSITKGAFGKRVLCFPNACLRFKNFFFFLIVTF